MKTNTLVTHNKLRTLGIGCVSKILSGNKVKVNFGEYDTKTCSVNTLSEIDTSKCKTVNFHKYKSRILMGKKDDNFDYCIVGNEVRHFVGIGWVTTGIVTTDDIKKYPRVID